MSGIDFIDGQVPTAAQWDAAFASKQDALGFSPLNKAGDTMSGRLVTAPSASARAMFNTPPGTAPAGPVAGDWWATTAGLFYFDGTTTFCFTKQGSTLLLTASVNFNATGDTTFPVVLPPGFTRYLVSNIRISGASHSLTTASFGLFTAAAAGGTAVISGSTAITVSATATTTNNNAQVVAATNPDTCSYTQSSVPSLFFHVNNAEGVAATGTVSITLVPLP